MPNGPAYCDYQPCSARITFVNVTKRAGGRSRMPLNDRPDPAGNVAVRVSGQSKIGRVVSKGQPLDADETLYMPHFATCPRPKDFRRRDTPPAAEPATPDPEPATLF